MNKALTLADVRVEELHLFREPESGLVALVAIHDRSLGGAKGGTRLRAYPDLAEAIREVVRLAQAMTLKFAVHGLPHGGGKALILQDERGLEDPDVVGQRVRAYGEFLERMGGTFTTGPDMGFGGRELGILRETTSFLAEGVPHEVASQATALGVLRCLDAGLQRVGRAEGVSGARIAIQGVGAVGEALARSLRERGAELVLADADWDKALAVAQDLGVDTLGADTILMADVDALAPCATGDMFSEETIAELSCQVIAGGANDQLVAPEIERARALAARGILYVPDFVANGGAAVALTGAAGAGDDAPQRAAAHVAGTLERVLARADEDEATPYEAAVVVARDTLAEARARAAEIRSSAVGELGSADLLDSEDSTDEG